MMKRLAGVLLASLLVLVLAGVSLAGEIPADQQTGDAQVAATLSAVPSGGDVSNIVFAVFAGTTNKDNASVREAALLLMKPLLARLVGTDANATIYKMDDLVKVETEDASLKNPEDLQKLYGEMMFTEPKANGSEIAFINLWQKLKEKYANIDPNQKIEIWLVDHHAPFSSANEDLDKALSGVKEMLNKLPGLEVHFVYLLEKALSSDDPGRIDKRLLQVADDPSRVTTHAIDLSNAGNAFDSVMKIIRDKLLAVVPCADMTAAGKKDVWEFTYSHRPIGETGRALLLLPPGPEIENFTIEKASPAEIRPADPTATPVPADAATPATPAKAVITPSIEATPVLEPNDGNARADILPGYIAGYGKNAGWVLMIGTPAGDYTVTLTLKSSLKEGLSPPALKAYLMMDRPEINLTYLEDPQDKQGKPFDGSTSWYRGQYMVNICSSDAGLKDNPWEPSLFLNGVKAENIKIDSIPTDEGWYLWRAAMPVVNTGKLTMQAVLDWKDVATFCSDPVSVNVQNHTPTVNANPATEYTIKYDFPGENTVGSLPINLGSLFQDAENDQLYYGFVDDPNNIGSYRAEIKDQNLEYTPFAGSGKKDIALTLWATDFSPAPDFSPEGEVIPSGAASVKITIHQRSLTECIKGWKYVFVPEKSEGVSMDGPGEYSGIPGRQLKLVYALMDSDKALEPFSDYKDTNLNRDSIPNYLTVSVNAPQDNSDGVVPDVNLSSDTLTLTFPSTNGSTQYNLQLNASFKGVPLPDLIEPIKLSVYNSPPVLRDGVDAQQELKTYIYGFPWNPTPVSLAEILHLDSVDLKAYFTDRETPENLTYALFITGSAGYEFKGLKPDRPPDAGQEQYELGSSALEMTLTTAGTLNLGVTAKDGDEACTLMFRIHAKSFFYHILWLVVLCLLVLLALTAAALTIRYLLLPSFGNIGVTVSVASDFSMPAFPGNFSGQVSLQAFGKKSVSLLSLLMLFRVPPQNFLSAGVANDIRIRPARHSLAVISLGRRAARQGFLINGNKVRGRSCAVTAGQWEITAGGQVSSDAVILTFQGNEDRSWDHIDTGTIGKA